MTLKELEAIRKAEISEELYRSIVTSPVDISNAGTEWTYELQTDDGIDISTYSSRPMDCRLVKVAQASGTNYYIIDINQ